MANLETREVAMSAVSMPNLAGNPFQTRAMDLADIREVRRWHRNAALRAKEADFDLVYIYATHGYLLSQFMSPEMNTRADAYGGSLENRIRLVREIIEDTKDAVGDKMAVAVRFSAETNGGYDGGDGNPMPGETEEIFGVLVNCQTFGILISTTIPSKWVCHVLCKKARWNLMYGPLNL